MSSPHINTTPRWVKKATLASLLFCTFSFINGIAYCDPLSIGASESKNAFPLSVAKQSAPIIVGDGDFEVVKIAAQCLSDDLEKVTGAKAALLSSVSAKPSVAILIGTIGKSPEIDALVTSKKLDVSKVRGQWESFTIATVQNPSPGIKQALVLAGSDRRGTAYAAFTLSQAIGVSPWEWWADVKPVRKSALWVNTAAFVQKSPSIQYRGIFINDEDFGLQPWAAKNFEPETKDIGPKTYAKVCELLLRLKANYLWPAMHAVTKPFNTFPQNKVVADQYAIVMGSSHAEPMLRNNLGEWDSKTMGPWNYVVNRDKILPYWDQRVKDNAQYENQYTIGMRGVHDSKMEGGGTTAEQVKSLESIFADQRALIGKYVNPDVEKVPQIFVPYKEVLNLYQNGLKVPDDVTLVWADDNHGYIRQLSTPEEQKRKGGAGVYYHLSYWGAPTDYLWLDTTSPALMWKEMTKAYDYDARKVWVVNVGDIKPQEVGLDLFMDLAWDIEGKRGLSQREALTQWATRIFGPQNASEIAALRDEYYRLNSVVRPELLRSGNTNFSHFAYGGKSGDEAQARLDQFAALVAKTDALYERIAPEQKDAFYQLMVYPIRGAKLQNEKVLYAERSRLYAAQGRVSANLYAQQAKTAFAQIHRETAYYNTKLAGGKWNGMMDDSPRAQSQFNLPKLGSVPLIEGAGLGVAVESSTEALAPNTEGRLDSFNPVAAQSQFVDIFSKASAPLEWTATANQPWIKLSETAGTTTAQARVWVSVDWKLAPQTESVEGTITISGAGQSYSIAVPAIRPNVTEIRGFKGAVQNGTMVSVEAENFTRNLKGNGVAWQRFDGLGRGSDAMSVMPVNLPSIEPKSEAFKTSPCLQYDVQMFTTGPIVASIFCSPTQRIDMKRGVRYAIALNDEQPQIVNLQSNEYSKEWTANIWRNAAIGNSTHTVTKAGLQTIRIWMIDPGVVLDKAVLSVGEPLPSFLGAPEVTKAIQ